MFLEMLQLLLEGKNYDGDKESGCIVCMFNGTVRADDGSGMDSRGCSCGWRLQVHLRREQRGGGICCARQCAV